MTVTPFNFGSRVERSSSMDLLMMKFLAEVSEVF